MKVTLWTRRIGRRLGVSLPFFGLLLARPVAACPVCFSAANETVLHTYYLTAVMMTVLPLVIVAVLGSWIYSRLRHAQPGIGMPAQDSPFTKT